MWIGRLGQAACARAGCASTVAAAACANSRRVSMMRPPGSRAARTIAKHAVARPPATCQDVPRRVALARSTIGVAVRHGAPKPEIGSADAFRRTLLAARSFARNEGADSGIYMKGLIERLGIAEQMKSKTTLVPSGYVAELVARG